LARTSEAFVAIAEVRPVKAPLVEKGRAADGRHREHGRLTHHDRLIRRCTVITGGDGVIVSSALELVAAPARLVTTTV